MELVARPTMYSPKCRYFVRIGSKAPGCPCGSILYAAYSFPVYNTTHRRNGNARPMSKPLKPAKKWHMRRIISHLRYARAGSLSKCTVALRFTSPNTARAVNVGTETCGQTGRFPVLRCFCPAVELPH